MTPPPGRPKARYAPPGGSERGGPPTPPSGSEARQRPSSGGEFDLSGFIDQTLATLRLAFTPAQRRQLVDYVGLLLRWNRVYNLTAIRDAAGIARLHIADCLAATAPIAGSRPQRLLDVGSGAGLPGLILAIALPEAQVHLVDTVQKKCAFLQQAAATLGLRNVTVHHARVESLDPGLGFDCITSRALSSLGDLVAASVHLIAPGGVWCAMKGQVPDREIGALPRGYGSRVQPLAVPGLDAERCLVWIRPPAQ